MSYLKYGGLAFQLVAVIGLGGWIGYEIDRCLGIDYPLFIFILGILFFVAVMVWLYRSIRKS